MSQILSNSEVKWFEKAAIGAVGGVCLALLKLIEAHFFVESPFSSQAIEAYLTYLAYIILGMVVAVFFSDHDLPKEKIKKNALISGLLAPSLLLALVNQPNLVEKEAISQEAVLEQVLKTVSKAVEKTPGYPATEMASDVNEIPNLEKGLDESNTSSEVPQKNLEIKPNSGIQLHLLPQMMNHFFIRSSYASDGFLKVSSEFHSNGIVIQTIAKEEVEPGLNQRLFDAISGSSPNSSYIFVIGKTQDINQAIEISKQINTFIETDKTPFLSKARVIKPVSTNDLYVTVGGITFEKEAQRIKLFAQSCALEILLGEQLPSDETKKAARLLLNGKVIHGKELFFSQFEKAEKWETLGLKYLVDGDFNNARQCFENAYKAHPQYHHVEEIRNILKNKEPELVNPLTRNQAKKAVYREILNHYSKQMSSEIKEKMKEQLEKKP